MGNIAEDYGQKENYTQKWEIYGTMDKRQATSGQKTALYGDYHSADYRNMGKAYYMHDEDGHKAEG